MVVVYLLIGVWAVGVAYGLLTGRQFVKAAIGSVIVMAGIFLGTAAIFAVVLGVQGWLHSDDADEVQAATAVTSAAKAEQYSIEHQAAIANANHWVDKDDITVKRMRFLLTSLEEKTGEPQMHILDMVAMTRKLLREHYGKEVSYLDLMEMANKSDALASKAVKLQEYLSLYLVMDGPR
jgi:hypothetical protein